MTPQITFTDAPLNSAPIPAVLAQHFITPVPLFFIRNHAPVPSINADDYHLRIDGLVNKMTEFSLRDLQQQFPIYTLTASLACAGNRRDELNAFQAISASEIVWGGATIGNATWTGVLLKDVLAAVGVTAGEHVAFEGADREPLPDGSTRAFGGSIPLTKALSGDNLLAFAMNDAPLPPDHGYPLRALVGGYIGARSVKWLERITVQNTPSTNYYQATAYRLHRPELPDSPMLGEQPLYALICAPSPNSTVPAGHVLLQGYAVPHGTETITNVELSLDGGATWQAAHLDSPQSAHSWVLWRIEADLSTGEYSIVARATDSGGNQQPSDLAQVWNDKGYVNNAYHRMTLYVG